MIQLPDHPPAWLLAVLVSAMAGLVLWYQILVGPNAPNYPRGKPALRAIAFVAGCALAYRAFCLWQAAMRGSPPVVWSQVITSMAMACFMGALVWDLLSKRKAAWVWPWVDRLLRPGPKRHWGDPAYPHAKTLAGQRFAASHPQVPTVSPDLALAVIADARMRGINASPPGESAEDYIRRTGQ